MTDTFNIEKMACDDSTGVDRNHFNFAGAVSIS